jgi:hypothetical protein
LFDGLILEDNITVEGHNMLDDDQIVMRVQSKEEYDIDDDDDADANNTGNVMVLNLRPHRGDSVAIEVTPETPMSVLLSTYASQVKCDVSTLRMRWDGDVIDVNKLVRDLEVEDGDLIDVEERK